MLREKLNSLILKLVDKDDDVNKWSRRVNNKEFYNTSYLPVPRETREVEELAKQFSSTGGLQNKTNEKMKHCLLSRNHNKPRSLILKREPVIYSIEEEEQQKQQQQEGKGTIIELILLNHSFIISLAHESTELKNEDKAKREIDHAANLVFGITKAFTKNVNILIGKKTIEGCFDLTSIVGIIDSGEEDSFSLLVKDDGEEKDNNDNNNKNNTNTNNNVSKLQISCGGTNPSERKDAWLHAFKVSVMNRYEISESSLLAAALYNDMTMIIRSVESHTLEIDETDSMYGYTSLHIAIINNNLDIATELLKGGANANKQSNDGLTPMHFALKNQNNDAITLLKKFGAEDKDERGISGMHTGTRQQQDEYNKQQQKETKRVGQRKFPDIPKVMAEKSPKLISNMKKLIPGYEDNVNRHQQREETNRKETQRKLPDIPKGMAEKSPKLLSNMKKLIPAFAERGERLERNNVKSNDLRNKAMAYGDMGKELRRKMENDKGGGWF